MPAIRLDITEEANIKLQWVDDVLNIIHEKTCSVTDTCWCDMFVIKSMVINL